MFNMLKKFLLSILLIVLISACNKTTYSPAWKDTNKLVSYNKMLSMQLKNYSLSLQEIKQIKQTLLGNNNEAPIYALLLIKINKNSLEKENLSKLTKQLKNLGIKNIKTSFLMPKKSISKQNNLISIILYQYLVNYPECADWDDKKAQLFVDQEKSNFNCATKRNFLKMVSTPEDLIDPQPIGKSDGMKQVLSVENFRKGKEEKIKVEKIDD